ncbi:hypothetical protein [Pseudomonas sp. BN415]|uniref:hypothetical protein n=1 Tax=Pseudomonas sp. BN415 TaxID=2567889 RepID=UPI00245903EA|nr:hypothetical protein [Pseudomonas sp. BN415]
MTMRLLACLFIAAVVGAACAVVNGSQQARKADAAAHVTVPVNVGDIFNRF